MKIKNEKQTVFPFPLFYENEKRMRAVTIQSNSLLNMKVVVSYLNFVFHIEVKTNSKYKFLNFLFQFIKNAKWHFGYTDFFDYYFHVLISFYFEVLMLTTRFLFS